ncbi:hypothetical protein Zmor_004530 [Zophobas morio]|uniref:SAM-dependent MTase RsmB/NOP-type domain-containing protein n=1 Tax=Zophobas morio TaxID=2755281 RepID=A0AA38HI58_9CUCU|nr:hypothetical protein Zmor_004530 [Zophobas morio]
MVPPLLLAVQRDCKVLDLCAAPGSKTCQLIEYLDGCGDATLVLANDSNIKRCHLLVHQTKRLRSPKVIVTNQDASCFPSLYAITGDRLVKALKFDCILADVPCRYRLPSRIFCCRFYTYTSGDGTLRKNPFLWADWKPSGAHGLHLLQCRILSRGVEMLAEGGALCYSTCSFNPVENEAVVAHVLNKFNGEVELIDVGDRLPGLRRVGGVSTWVVELLLRDIPFVRPLNFSEAEEAVYLCLWRGKESFVAMLEKCEAKSMLILLAGPVRAAELWEKHRN